ncbi:MAG: hypothetical protein ACEQSC_00115 [Candidatus Nanopelagicaceae bacterium]
MKVLLDNAVEKLQGISDPEMIAYLREEAGGITPPTEEIDVVIAEVYPQLLLDRPQLTDREKLDLMGLNWINTAKRLRDDASGYMGLFYCPSKEKLAEAEEILLSETFVKFREKLGVNYFLVPYPKPGKVWHYWDFDSFVEIFDEIRYYPDSSSFPPLLSLGL